MPRKSDPNAAPEALAEAGFARLLPDALRGLYTSTLRPGSWPMILQTLCPLFGTTKAMFFEVDRVCPSDSVTEGVGLAPEILEAMRGRSLDEDYMWQAALNLPAGSVFRSEDLHPSMVLYRGPLYERIAVPGGIEHVLSATLENTPLFFSNICFLRPETSFTGADKELLGQLVPHLQCALQIVRRVVTGDAGRREALLSFDRTRQPMIALDRSGYTIYCNEHARGLLASASGMRLKFGRFIFDEVAVQVEFERATRVALATPELGHPVSPLRIRVPRQGPGSPYTITVVSVHRAADRALFPEGARCMLLISDNESLVPLPTDRLAWLYHLTSAEVRICDALYCMGSVEAAAQHLSLTQHTVRSHLKSIYAKFGVSTQAQLMQRLSNSVRQTEGAGGPELSAGT